MEGEKRIISSSLLLSTGMPEVFARQGDKNVQDNSGGSGKEYITILGAGSAGGVHIPLYLVYKSLYSQ